MLRTLAIVGLLLCLVSFSGCLLFSKPAAGIAAGATVLAHGDTSADHYRAHYWTYMNDMQSLVDDFDKHFLRYDRNAPYSE